MGYTHYWTQIRDFTAAEWQDICADVGAILKEAQHAQGIALAGTCGEGGTSPEFSDDRFAFNGLGDDSHETLQFNRKRIREFDGGTLGGSFCKTARKPYDPVVTAVLCYMSTITRRDDPATGEPVIGSEAVRVSSDGNAGDFLAGLELARRALPRKANQLDYPMQLMQADRWCGPWINDSGCKSYRGDFCIDGHAYVTHVPSGATYRFDSHQDFAVWLERHKHASFKSGRRLTWGGYGREESDIWHAMGSFDPARHARIYRAQAKAYARLFPVPPEHAHQPPAYARPGDMPANAGREFCYSISDLLDLARVAA